MIDQFSADILLWFNATGNTGIVFSAVFSFIIGACFGSFTTACVWRIPRNISILWPPSSCPKCKHRITALENIPMISWLALRGKCSGCGLPISPRYFWIEFSTAILFTAVELRFAIFDPAHILSVIPYWILIVLAVGSACTDMELRIIPDKFTYTAMILGMICAYFIPFTILPNATRLGSLVFSMISAAVFLVIGYGLSWFGRLIFKREALGLGDVKYAAAAAMVLGAFGTVAMMTIACILSLLWVLFQRLFYRKYRKSFPFGPFLAAATALWCIFGYNPYL